MEKASAKSSPAPEANARTIEGPQQNSPNSHSLLRLQKAAGNQAVARLLRARDDQARRRPARATNEPTHDPSESSQAAGAALSPPASSPLTQRHPSAVDDVLQSPGQPLDAATRAVMEPRLGYD